MHVSFEARRLNETICVCFIWRKHERCKTTGEAVLVRRLVRTLIDCPCDKYKQVMCWLIIAITTQGTACISCTLFIYSKFLGVAKYHARIQRKGEGVVQGFRTPIKITQLEGSLATLVRIPGKSQSYMYQVSIQFWVLIGPPASRWYPTFSGIWIFESSPHINLKKKKEKLLTKLDPLWHNISGSVHKLQSP